LPDPATDTRREHAGRDESTLGHSAERQIGRDGVEARDTPTQGMP
jgi:hypothetical protein